MKLIYLALPLLGSLAIAQSLIEDDCQCPQVKCPDSDTFEGCRCTNLAELRCKRRCPNYTPTKFKICPLLKQRMTRFDSSPTLTLATPTLPILGFPTPALPTPALPSSLVLPDKPLIPGCECEEMMCLQSFPDSCHCAYNIAKTCWDKCGGKSPGLNTCPPLDSLEGNPFDGPVKRAAAPELQAAPGQSTVPSPVNPPALVSAVLAPLASGTASTTACQCEERMCIQAFPESCICANSNKHACWKKCGGAKPAFQFCTSPRKPTRTFTKPTPTPTVSSLSRRVQICGGGRANTNLCPTGYTCIDDPYKLGVDGYCGLACDQPGICVEEQLCGGIAGIECEGAAQGQVCVDDPRDDCSLKNGGADCGGLCVWPPALRTT